MALGAKKGWNEGPSVGTRGGIKGQSCPQTAETLVVAAKAKTTEARVPIVFTAKTSSWLVFGVGEKPKMGHKMGKKQRLAAIYLRQGDMSQSIKRSVGAEKPPRLTLK